MRSLTKIKEENRILIREIAQEFLNDPLHDIEDYDEWLETLINSPNDMKLQYRKIMKATLILQFYKIKILELTGIRLNKIMWQKLPEDGLILWPKGDKSKRIAQLPLNQLNEILRILDRLKLSDEFLRNIKQPEKSTSLVATITQHASHLLHDYVIKWKKQIPWVKLTRADFVNWPEDVPVKRPDALTFVQRKKLYDVLERIKLSDHFTNTYLVRLGYVVEG